MKQDELEQKMRGCRATPDHLGAPSRRGLLAALDKAAARGADAAELHEIHLAHSPRAGSIEPTDADVALYAAVLKSSVTQDRGKEKLK